MNITRIRIQNFRGIEKGELFLPKHAVFVGDNNTCKSTVLEAIDLVLGPERLFRRPVIDEHDFFAGKYLDKDKNPIEIRIELVVTGLSEEQRSRFKYHEEFWDEGRNELIALQEPEATDRPGVLRAVRVQFIGNYDPEEDDFKGKTYFCHPETEEGELAEFGTVDKRLCGFLFLRTIRTGARALSLERGSLLDIILKLQNKRLHMWEDILSELRKLPVAEKKELGIGSLLSHIQHAVRSFVPSDWAENPHMKVSDLTRETLRKYLSVFMCTGMECESGKYAAPFQHQGTGTINTLVLAMLSMIADLKADVIFAMEEPEIAIPPHTQKQIIHSVRQRSSQAIFTSHSPYVLEEFDPTHIIVFKRVGGSLSGTSAELPGIVKPKFYRKEIRARFCEALLARRILLAEGDTEYDAYPVAARRLSELDANRFKSLEAMGIAVLNAESHSNIAPLGEHFTKLGKTVFAAFDKQKDTANRAKIGGAVAYPFESPESGFERLIVNGTGEAALRRYALGIVSSGDWPDHLASKKPTATMDEKDLRDAMYDFFEKHKATGKAGDMLHQCDIAEMPNFIVDMLAGISEIIAPSSPKEEEGVAKGEDTKGKKCLTSPPSRK